MSTTKESTDGALERVAARYAVAITPAMEALIDPADPHDPIAAQFRPDTRELQTLADENADPIGDTAHSPCPGIVHRYPDRCLLTPLHVCAVYCRYCFRREVVGPRGDGMLDAEALETALGYIAAHPDIWEVILTGGDPLVLSPRRIAALTARLDTIAHVKIQRWHTRLPIVDPARIDHELCTALRAARAATWMVVHVNHPRELTAQARAALARLADAGIPLLAHSVLLRGVNDDAATLVWNGPLGAFEMTPFDRGTVVAAKHAAERTRAKKLISVAGGGDTVAALNQAGVGGDFSYVSTAGGAFLEWMEGIPLPGVEVLRSR